MAQEILVSLVILGAIAYLALRISGKRRKKPKQNKRPDVPLSRLKRSAKDVKKAREDSFDESGK